jgi:uncharacterized protein YbjT (DUF2867 family)
VAERLSARGLPVRIGSRSNTPRFDWDDDRTWAPALRDVSSVYLSYYPDLAIDGAAERVHRFSRQAVDLGVRNIVLLAGRGEPQVLPSEKAVRESGAAYTILECAFFCQNFSEAFLAPEKGEIVFPPMGGPEPFIDADDIADVAVAALTDGKHAGKTYELTGPRLLTLEDAAREISEASGKPIRYVPVSFETYGELLEPVLPPGQGAFFVDLFRFVLDGHNAHVTNGMELALGRKARDFRDYARDARRAWGASPP